MSDRNARQVFGFVAVVAVGVVVMLLVRPSSPTDPAPVPIVVPVDEALHPGAALFDLSPDGSFLVYRRRGTDGLSQLWRRPVAEGAATAIPGTDGAHLPAVSADGLEVAFTAGADPAAVRVVVLATGSVRTLADSASDGGVRWSPDGAWVYYAHASGGLRRVATEGGDPEVLTRPDTVGARERHWGVEALPDGGTILFTSSLDPASAPESGASDAEDTEPWVELLDLASGERTALRPGSLPRYSVTGHIVFFDPSGGSLAAAPFDAERGGLGAAPVTLVRGVARAGEWPLYALSRTGTLVYGKPAATPVVTPVWVDRSGAERQVEAGWRLGAHPTYTSLALSPDGSRLAISVPTPEGRWDVWVRTVSPAAGAFERLTTAGSLNYRPTWAPDGRSLTFISDRAGQADLWSMGAAGDADAERVLDRPGVVRNAFRTPAGDWIVFREGEAPVADILALPLGGAGGSDVVPLVTTEAGERSPALSPNGRWLAYTSNALGGWQVWVAAFPEGGGARRVSVDGGEEPVWSRGGGELFYRDRANRLVAVEVTDAETLRMGDARVLFSMEGYLASDGRPQYDVTADGGRFVMLRLVAGGRVELLRLDDAVRLP